MPLLFPSHPGLMAPLWRRWPRGFTPLAASVGAMAPDLVDGAIGLLHRGHLGQGYGHSLLGLFFLCVPAGLVINGAVKAAGRRLGRSEGRFPRRISAAIERWSALDGAGGPGRRLAIEAWSVWAGALSHLLADFVSHGNFLWLYPWYEDPGFFPAWWHARWFELPLPFYESPYPCGPPFVVWVILSVLGGVLLFRRPGGRPHGPRDGA